MSNKNEPQIQLLVDLIDRAFEKKSWHGTNLLGSLRGLKPEKLLWRPGPKRHNIWEIAIHTAYWKYAIYRQISGSEKGAFPRKPSNWPALPEKTNFSSWQEDLKLLKNYHAKLKQAVMDLSSADLDNKRSASTWSIAQKICGVASHDLYHAGQIQLLKRLMKK